MMLKGAIFLEGMLIRIEQYKIVSSILFKKWILKNVVRG